MEQQLDIVYFWKTKKRLALVDTGIGLLETQNPIERIGQELIDMVGFRFNENQTTIKQLKQMGFNPEDLNHCILTHLDPDHIGGLVDFPNATVHVAKEEYENFNTGNPRYLPIQLAHNPTLRIYGDTVVENWLGFDARRISVDFEAEIFLVPLFGHTMGHCGVAIKQKDKLIFFIGDAYYLRAETEDENHSISQLATMRADNNELRLSSLDKIKELIKMQPEIGIFGYHDPLEFNN